MCTASWGSLDDGASDLVFNRDERRQRTIAEPPAIASVDGVKAIMPTDRDGGGTWIVANEHGFCASLLNNYSAEARSSDLGARAGLLSRGFVPLAFADCRSVQEAAHRWETFECTAFRPFLALFWDRSGGTRLFSWDGKRSGEVDLELPMVTTSSYKTDAVEGYRRELFRRLATEAVGKRFDRLGAFHFDDHRAEAAFNPLMSREDSATHSVSLIQAGGDELRFSYWARDLKSGKLGKRRDTRLALRR